MRSAQTSYCFVIVRMVVLWVWAFPVRRCQNNQRIRGEIKSVSSFGEWDATMEPPLAKGNVEKFQEEFGSMVSEKAMVPSLSDYSN